MGTGAVVIRFSTDGSAAVNAAFASVAARAKELGRIQSASAQSAARASVAAQRHQVDEATRMQRKLAQEASKIEKAQVASADRAAQAEIRARQREVQSAQKAWDEKLKIAQRAERQMTAAGEREIAKRQRAEAAASRFTAERRGSITGAISRAGRGTFGTVAGIAGGLGVGGGVTALASGLMSGVDLEAKAAQLSNSVTMGGILPPSMTSDKLAAMAQRTAKRAGIRDAGDVIEGMSEVSAKAGGAKGLNAFLTDLDDVSMTARAAGVSMKDLGGVYAASLNAGIKPGEDMRDLLRSLVEIGKNGQVEFADLAAELPRLAGAGLSTELRAGDMVKRQVALAQIAAKQQVSPEESRTATRDVFRDINSHASELRLSGVNAYNKSQQIRDPRELLGEIIDRTMTRGITTKGGHVLKGQEGLSHVFTGTSLSIASSLAEEYRNAGGGAKGKAAIAAAIDAAGGGTMSEAQRNEQFAKIAGTNEFKIAQAMADFQSRVYELLPQMSRLIPEVGRAANAFASVASWAARNPFEGVGVLFGANLAKEVASANIATVMQGGLTKSLSSLSVITMTAATVYLVGQKLLDEAADEGKAKGLSKNAAIAEASNLRSEIVANGGAATPEQRARAAELAKKIEGFGDNRSTLERMKDRVGQFINPLSKEGGLLGVGRELLRNNEEKANLGMAADPKAVETTLETMKALSAAGTDATRVLREIAAIDAGSMASPKNNARSGAPGTRSGVN